MEQCNTIKGNQSNRPEYKKENWDISRVVSYWIDNTLFLQM